MPASVYQTPTPPLIGGNSVREPILKDYIFQSGIQKPEHSSILSYKFPQYYLTALLERLGAAEPVAADVWSWNVLDRTRLGATVDANLTTLGSTTITFDTAIVYSGANKGYFIVGDVVRLESGQLGRVTATAENSGVQELTIQKVGGGNWATGDIAADDTLGHAYNSFPEGSEAPDGRLYLPIEENNTLQILRRSFKISGSEFTNRTYLGDGKSWYFEKEDVEMKEFARDREIAIMFGVKELGGSAAARNTKGIWEYALADGVVNGFAASTGVSETDLQDQMRDLLKQGVSNEITVLCGAQFLADANRALVDYAIAGAQEFGKGASGNMAGLDFQSYKFLGKIIHFAYYELFDDTAVLPAPQGGPAATDVDFSNTSLWLDMGSDSGGQKLITMKYKALDGESRQFIHGYEVGMMNPQGQNGGMVSSGFDGFRIHYISEIGIEVRLANRCGILKATS